MKEVKEVIDPLEPLHDSPGVLASIRSVDPWWVPVAFAVFVLVGLLLAVFL